ncbi:MAG: endonuclease/exonuclease/phosphatase family protein [Mycobacterium sp.]
MSPELNIATWNTQWATLKTDRGHRVRSKLRYSDFDAIVITEGARDLLPSGGHMVDAGADWGYGLKLDRRKVIVWSRFPLSLESLASTGAALGRLAVATVATPGGAVRVIGVCIPWRDAHVSTGRSDASSWSEHLQYLDQLDELLETLDDRVPTVIAGDFNQRIPRVRQPDRVAHRLTKTFADWTIHTTGNLSHGPHIDHIASNAHLACRSTSDWLRADGQGVLSDHAGVSCRLVIADRTAPVAAAEHSPAPETRVSRLPAITNRSPSMNMTDDTPDSLISALRKSRIPSENHAFIRRITETVGISQYRAVEAAEPYVAAVRRDGLRELRIYSGYTTGFTTADEATRVGVGAEVIRPSSKLKGVWLVSHPKHGDLGRRDGRTRNRPREAAICPTCFQELPRTRTCDNCD